RALVGDEQAVEAAGAVLLEALGVVDLEREDLEVLGEPVPARHLPLADDLGPASRGPHQHPLAVVAHLRRGRVDDLGHDLAQRAEVLDLLLAHGRDVDRLVVVDGLRHGVDPTWPGGHGSRPWWTYRRAGRNVPCAADAPVWRWSWSSPGRHRWRGRW